MAAVVAWGRIVFVGPEGVRVGSCVVAGPGQPDLGTVDVLARLQLHARRRGGSIRVTDMSAELAALLDLAGLLREVGGEPEGGEQVLDVQEGVEPGDPTL